MLSDKQFSDLLIEARLYAVAPEGHKLFEDILATAKAKYLKTGVQKKNVVPVEEAPPSTLSDDIGNFLESRKRRPVKTLDGIGGERTSFEDIAKPAVTS